ncbi:MAG: imidazole glycerol phosphate synthase subunit HisH [Gemmatimonadota bacterium]|nr:imidazole glycerol phosphate synthase subunit HisH [Gemmatimonadota bacterium]
MSEGRVRVVRTSTANLAAVRAAFRRLGHAVDVTDDPDLIAESARVVLPGVGAFSAALDAVRSRGLHEAVEARVRGERATLAVCLGLQLLAEGSEEAPGVSGLSILKGSAKRFDPSLGRVPHMGWNRIEAPGSADILRSGHGYFAHSYRLEEAPEGWTVAWSEYGGRFVAAVERGLVLACQFHPELSGRYGAALLSGWLEAGT